MSLAAYFVLLEFFLVECPEKVGGIEDIFEVVGAFGPMSNKNITAFDFECFLASADVQKFVISYKKKKQFKGTFGCCSFILYIKKSLKLPSFPVFHISLAAVALFKCQTPEKHVMEVNLRAGNVFLEFSTVADVFFFSFFLPF